MTRMGMVLASAAAALFAAGVGASAQADHHEGKVKCEGGNACNGKGECKTALHDCGGKNSCKGKGWVYLTPEECEKAKAEQES